MRPYSLDLRQKIIDTYLEGKLSQRQIAEQFRVAYSFVRKLTKQYRETGDIQPKQRLKQTPTKLNETQLITLQQLVKQHNDATLAELCDLLEEAVGIRISVTTMFRMLQKLKITLKKNTASRWERNRTSTAATIWILATGAGDFSKRLDLYRWIRGWFSADSITGSSTQRKTCPWKTPQQKGETSIHD